MVVDHSVSTYDVRLKLNNPSQGTLSTERIAAEIEDAAVVVSQYAAADADEAAVNHAVKVAAAYGLLRDAGGMTEVAVELDIREEINVQAVIDSLQREREEALSLVSADAGRPSLHSLGSRYPPR